MLVFIIEHDGPAEQFARTHSVLVSSQIHFVASRVMRLRARMPDLPAFEILVAIAKTGS